MVIGHEIEAADVALEGDEKFLGEPQAEPCPQEGFKILVIVINDIGAVLN